MKPLLIIFLFLITYSSKATTTWTIGATGTYSSIANAWAAFPSPITDDYILEIKSDYTQESLPITLTAVNGASATYTITIRPETGVTSLALSGTTETQVIYFNGADYIIVDGRPGGSGTSELTLENSSTDNADRVLEFDSDATNNVVKYCSINGSNSSTINGVVVFSTASAGGNDNNTIDNCVFDESGSNKPACYIYSSGSASHSNSGNIISNNEFTEFSKYGINLTSSNNDAWTITDNSFYQDAAMTLTTNMHIIYVDDGGGYTVTGNFIGGQAASCGGSAFTINSAAYYIMCIDFGSNVDGASNTISNNTIQNFDVAGTATYVFFGIETDGTADYVIGSSGNGNLIGKTTGTGNIQVTATTATPSTIFAGIRGWSTGTYSIAYNTIASITADGSATGSDSFDAIYVGSTAGAPTIDNNTIGSTVAQNIVISTTKYDFVGIDGATNANTIITNNTIQNVDYNGTGSTGGFDVIVASGSGTNTITDNTIGSTVVDNMACAANIDVRGIFTLNGTHEIDNNTIQEFNLTLSSTSTNFKGIYINSGSNTSTDGNTIKGITSSGSSTDAFIGIYNGSGANSFSSNTIEDITCTGEFVGIESTIASVSITLNSNVIGSATDNNMTLSGNLPSYGMYLWYNSTYTCNNSTIREFNCTNTGGSNEFHAFYLSAGTISMDNCVVDEIDIITTDITNPSLTGIHLTTATNGSVINNCHISDLHQTNTGASAPDLAGIYIDDSGNATITKNHIEDGSTFSSAFSGWIVGIYNEGSGNINYYNNVILWDMDGRGEAPVLRGIMEYGSGTTIWYHNTVYVYGTRTTGTGTAAAFTFNNASGTCTIKNNIFVSNRAGTGFSQYGFRGISMGTMTVDENYLESTDILGRWASVDKTTIADWRTASGASSEEESQAAGSITIDANGYVSAGYATYIEDAGEDLSGTVSTDKGGTARDATPWKGAFESATVLPVEWLSFTGELLKEEVKLNWVTGSELNCDYFLIQKQNSLGYFETVGEVAGSGTTTEANSYTYFDEMKTELQYYRLKQVDFDGGFEYSNTIVVRNKTDETNESSLLVLPGDDILFNNPQEKTVLLYNSNGQLINITKVNALFKVPPVSTGIYVLRDLNGSYSKIISVQ